MKKNILVLVALTVSFLSWAADPIRITGNGGTISAETEPSSLTEKSDKLIDLVLTTKYYRTNYKALWFQYESPVAAMVSTYEIASANDVPDRDPKDWELLGSNDGVSWTLMDSRTGETFATRRLIKIYTINSSVSFKYFRLKVLKNASDKAADGLQLSEWNLYGYQTLPVDLIGFSAKAEGSGIYLSWSTASEKNNSHFEILRSEDGTDFKGIAMVKGSGNTNTVSHYSYKDLSSIAKTNYYRLKQVDYNGDFELSKIIFVNGKLDKKSMYVIANSTDGTFSAVIYSQQKITSQFTLYNSSGRQLYRQSINLERGPNTLKLPVQFLPDLYIANLVNASEKVSIKFTTR